MAVHHLILSLLEDGPSYGYELKIAFEKTVGPQWGTVNVGHIYQLLQRLERDGSIITAGAADAARGPERRLYESTPTGREELDRWLAAPVPPPAGYRTELFLKLAAAVRRDAAHLDSLLRSERRAALDELRALRALAREDAEALVHTLIDGAIAQVEARLSLLQAAESRRTDLLLQHASPASSVVTRESDVPSSRARQARRS